MLSEISSSCIFLFAVVAIAFEVVEDSTLFRFIPLLSPALNSSVCILNAGVLILFGVFDDLEFICGSLNFNTKVEI